MRHLILGLSLAVAVISANAADMALHSYALQNHGTLELKAPASWNDSVNRPRGGMMPPTIMFMPRSGADFRVLVTPIWPARPDVKQATPESRRKLVRKVADEIAPQSVEKSLDLKEIKGAGTQGYYFSATDPAPKPGEYKYMNQGVIGVGELEVTFTILTNDGQDDVVKAALAMLANAAQH